QPVSSFSMRFTMYKMLMITLLATSSLFAWSNPTTAKVDYIIASTDGAVFFQLEGGKKGTAGGSGSTCKSDYASEYTLNTATDGGKSMYAMLLTAKSTGSKVTVQALPAVGCW